MAQELDQRQLQCDNEDGRLVVAFGYWGRPWPPDDGWVAFCSPCLRRYQHDGDAEVFFYVRFRADPADHGSGSGHDHVTTTPDDLKPDGERADNNDP